MAETLGKTVDELLTGKPGPISNGELGYWAVYWGVKSDIQDTEAKKKAPKAAPEGPKMKKTMGS